ncbi:MAG TPA: ankyrin repeat domain-containing protein [Fimbriimonadaceae bacterium]|nr:ankyrin repeat domain-containing protein [Fimbriimonadaceae bacterium]
MRRLLPLFFAFASMTGAAWAGGPTKTISTLPGLEIWNTQGMGYEQGKTPGNVRRAWIVTFKNETRQEVAEIDVRLRVEIEGQTVYKSRPIAITQFNNLSYPHSGSLLPMNRTFPAGPLWFEYPGRFWRVDSQDYIDIVAIRVYTAKQDLHDAGHLLTWLGGHNSTEAIAIYKAHPELLHVHNNRNMTAFMIEFAVGDVPTIKYMAAHGCSWSDKSTGGTTILHMAALHDGSHLALAVEHVKSLEVKTVSGHTPLMTAIQYGNQLTVSWLLQHKANPNAVDASKLPVAYYAITGGMPWFLPMLVKAGANPRHHDPQGSGWLHYAAAFSVPMLEEVAKYHVPIDDRVGKGLTPLMMCAWGGNMAAAEWLLRHGANPNLKDAQGRDCFELAKLSNTLHTDRFFRMAMARAGRGG